ncbi:hypothetical protein [Parasphingorhabdus sp.]|uniref:hypothetical protein n=1 Tax=Parasphingorhabdus sp. TaxID=2709688 RepID=UPI003BAEB2D2
MIEYQILAKQLATIDDSAERAAIAVLEADQRRDLAAIETAGQIIAQAQSEIRDLRSSEADVSELVEGLRSGQVDDRSKESEDVLRQKVQVHRESIHTMQKAMDERKREISAIQTKLRVRIAEHTADATRALHQGALEAIERLAKLYVDTQAIAESLATKEASDLRHKLTKSIQGMWADWPELRNRSENVSPGLVDALSRCDGSINLSGGRIVSSFRLPSI